jgi:proteasome lid subunit RPN8/RPN11
MVDAIDGLWVDPEHWKQMLADVNSRPNEEACGLLGGCNARVLEVFPVTNALHSPERYRMDPSEQVHIFVELERRGWDLLAIYHSHPAGPPTPSPTDITEAAYPEAIHLIWSQQAGKWDCHGFIIRDGQVQKITIHLIKQE